MRYLKWAVPLLLVSVLGCSGNSIIASNEIASAQDALQTARNAQASSYAGEQYKAAENTLNQARQQMQDKEYNAAIKLSRVAALQAHYATAVAQWKIKSNEVGQAQAALQMVKSEVDFLRSQIEEVKKQVQ